MSEFYKVLLIIFVIGVVLSIVLPDPFPVGRSRNLNKHKGE